MLADAACRQPLTPEQSALAARHAGLAYHMVEAAQFRRPELWVEFRDAATDALINSARLFDESRPAKFAGLLRKQMRWAVARVHGAAPPKGFRRQKTGLPYPCTLSGTDLAVNASAPSGEAAVDGADWVAGCLCRLPPQQREICRLRFLEGIRQRGIAKRMGLTDLKVHQLIADSVAFLRPYLEGRGMGPRGAVGLTHKDRMK
jgi:hypothetical protein